MERVVLGFVAFVLATSCVAGCGENSNRVYNVRQRRDKLSENVVIGVDYVGKPKIVCHCDAEGVQRLTSKSILASKRHDIVKVKPESLKTGLNETAVQKMSNFTKSELKQNETELMYSPSCCKIDLTNPRKLYTYPFTLRLPDKTFTEKLKDRTSKEYQELKNELLPAVTTLLANEGCVVQIEIKGFREGSVLADVALTVQGVISQSIIDTLKSAIESGNIGGVRVEVVPELPPDELPTTTPKPTTPKPTTPKPGTTVPPAQTTPKTTPPGLNRDSPATTTAKPTTSSKTVATVAPTGATPKAGSTTPKAGSTTPKTVSTTPKPPTTPTPVITPEIPVDVRPTIPYSSDKPGKEFEAAITLPEKSFDANLNIPSSAQYLELKKMIEESLKEIYTGNPDFLSVTVLRFRPAAYKPPKTSSTGTAAAGRRSAVPLKGIEVTLDFKFRTAKPGQLMALESQLKIGTIASHVVSPEMAAVIINEEPQGYTGPGNAGPGNGGPGNAGPGNGGPTGNSGQACPSNCRQPNVCFPSCSDRCCSPPQAPSCPSPCSSGCAPSCTSSCCALTKRSSYPNY